MGVRRRLFAIVMTLALVLSMSSAVFADSPESGNTDPAKVTYVTTVASGTTALTVNITAENAKKYVVRYRVVGGSWTTKAASTSASQKITGLKTGKCYDIEVAAINSAGTQSAWYNKSTWCHRFMKSVSPKATRGKGKITVKWSKVSGATNYQIRYNYVKSKLSSGSKSQTATSRKISGKKGKKIYYKVRPNKKVSGTWYYGIFSSVGSSSAK